MLNQEILQTDMYWDNFYHSIKALNVNADVLFIFFIKEPD